jgi:RHS repeat-associated protein
VQWVVQDQGSQLTFPNLTAVTSGTTSNTYFNLVAQNGGTMSLPGLTSITQGADGLPYANSGMGLSAHDSGTLQAPVLTTFIDNNSFPNSGLTAYSSGTLSVPKLLAPVGVNLNLNSQSNPQQFTSLQNATSIQINSGTATMSNLNSVVGLSSILVNGGAQVSFPNVSTYAVPGGTNVNWTVQDQESQLTFPNLTTITSGTTPNTYLNLVAQNGGTMSLPDLTSITQGADGLPYANSGIGLTAHDSGTLVAAILSTFNDINTYPNSGLTAYNSGTLSVPKLIAPVGVNINLNSLSDPQQFTSLQNATSIQINNGTVTMSSLNSVVGLSSILVNGGAQVSFPNVTTFAVPGGANVQWVVQDQGSQLTFPNLTAVTSGTTSNTYFNLVAQNGGTMSLPGLTSITQAADGLPYANSGMGLSAHDSGTLQAPVLTTFIDNNSFPNSGLTAYNSGTLSVPKLVAPVGVNINLNSQSNPQQFTSLQNATSIQINSGTATMSNLNSVVGLSSILVNGGAQVSFPNVSTYAVPGGANVNWTVQDQESQLTFPNLTTITSGTTPNTYLNLIAQNGGTMSLPDLTSITQGADGLPYANSGIGLTAHDSGTLVAAILSTFNDNNTYPNSGLTAYNSGTLYVPDLMASVGVNVNEGGTFYIPVGQTYVGYGQIQNGVFNDGLIETDFLGETLQINGPLESTGTVKVNSGATLSINGSFTLDGSALLSLSPSTILSITGDFLGTTTNTAGADPLGTLLFNGTRTFLDPQHLEAMSKDLGPVFAGFVNNFAFGTLVLANNTYVQLVDESRNTTSTSPECVYADSVVIPAGCTLDLNGLHLYARAVQLAGTVLHGSITQIPNAGPLAVGVPTPGALSTAGELDEWTFSFLAGRSVTIVVNSGTSGSPSPVLPQLEWANVVLLDGSNNVLASGSTSNAGDVVQLSNIPISVTRTYKIHINAPGSNTSATGNYIVAAYDATPNIRSLNLGQSESGNIAAPYAVDKWTFSAVAGQQIQVIPSGDTAPGVVFELDGPSGYSPFQSLSMPSQLIDLPASGTYTVTAYGFGGATGGYSFLVNQTSITGLALNTPYAGTWGGSGQAQLFTIPVTTANPLSVILSDSNTADHTEVYARFGAAPTRQVYDYGANGSGSSHNLLVPSAKAGTWYVLVYGESIPSASGGYTLQANSSEVVLSNNSTTQSASNINTVLTLTGAGFNSGSVVTLVSSGGIVYSASNSSTDLPTQITATFTAGSLPAGTYTVHVTQADGTTTQLPTPVTIAAVGQGILTTHLTVPNPIGRHIASTFYLDYANTGNAPMPAPLLNVYGTNPSGLQGAFFTLNPALITSGFWTSATPAGYSHSVQILASGATPGVLQPGESVRVPIYYAGWTTDQWSDSGYFNFYVAPVQASDTTPVDWASMESAMQPPSISAAAWHIIYGNLLPQLGTTSGGYVGLLDTNAAYLGQLGENVTDINALWDFAVTQAMNLQPLPALASTVDDSLPVVGNLSLSFNRAFSNSIAGRFQAGPLGMGWMALWQRTLSVGSDGTVTITNGNGSQFTYQPDSRYPGQYFSQIGDHSVLTAVNGGYQLQTLDGTIISFQTSGALNYLQDPNGNKLTAAYTSGSLTGLTASSGNSLTVAYNSAGLISTLTDTAGRVTMYSYDSANQYLLSVKSYTGKTTSYTYNATAGSPSLNAMTSISFPDGTHQYFTYDAQGRLAGTSVDGGAEPKTYSYSLGQVSITDAAAATSSLYFNENGQVAKTLDALGNPTFFNHDSNYNLIGTTNALGISSSYTVNGIGKVTAATDFLGNTTNFEYNGPQNQLTKLADAKGNTTQYSYNSTGQRIGTVFANGNSESSTFGASGDSLSFVNAAGEPIQYTHNAAGQLTSASFPDGSSYNYIYSIDGLLTSAIDSSGTTTFTYNPSSRVLTEVTYPNGTSLAFTYNGGGRRVSMADQTGYTTNYIYDTLGRLSSLNDGSGNLIVSYAYDADGRLTQKTNGNGTYTIYQYDANGQLLHLINYAPGGIINSRFDDAYNEIGLKTTETNLDGTWTYAYDANGQLTHAVFASTNSTKVASQDLVYNYDSLGNRTSTVINGVTTMYVANNMNQYTSIGGAPCIYDEKGNLLSDGTNTYSYNILNELQNVTNGSGSTIYKYNSLGQRISSTENGEVTQYLIDPVGIGDAVATFDLNDNLIAETVYGLGLARESKAGATLYYDSDPLGSIVGLSNSSGGYVNLYRYLPFGENLGSVETVANPFQFVGAFGVTTENDGLQFMRARFMDNESGRFMTADPLRLGGGDVNLYRYTLNNPLTSVDPLGTIGLKTIGWFTPIPLTVGQAWFSGLTLMFTPSNIGGDPDSDHIIPASDNDNGYLPSSPSLNGPNGDNDSSYVPPYPPSSPPSGDNSSNNGSGDSNDGSYTPPFSGDNGDDSNDGSYIPPVPGPGPGPDGPYPLPTPPPPPTPPTPTPPAQPQDPNNLTGPVGYGVSNFVADLGNTFAYRITFENAPTATAPAQVVTVTNQLDSNLDWSTFQLTGIGFGDNNIAIPSGRQSYETTVSMTYNGQTFNVQIEAGIHSDTGQVYATFQSIDPNTSLPPANVLTGFLPPEDGTGRGTGYLTYTVSPKSGLATGTAIPNVASIVFDDGQPITTDQVDPEDPSKGTTSSKEAIVTIDSMPPVSRVAALPAQSPDAFWVHWSGSDPVSGVAGYSIFVSDDGGSSWSEWLSDTTKTSAIYTGEAGKTYEFYSEARDGAGNIESKSAPDTSTEVTTGTNFQGSVIVAKNDPAPGVSEAKFLLADSPAEDALGNVAFKAFITGTGKPSKITGANNSGIWFYTGTNGSLVEQTGTNAPETAGAVFTSLSDPAMHAEGSLAYGAGLKGGDVVKTKTNAAGIWLAGSGTSSLILRTGTAAADEQGTTYSQFEQIATQQPTDVAFLAKLAGADLKPTNNLGLWGVDLSGTTHAIMRTGEVLMTGTTEHTVKSINVFGIATKEKGQSRSVDTLEGDVAFGLTFTDHSSAIAIATPMAVGFDREIVADTEDTTVPGIAKAKFTAFGTPAVNANGTVAFRATVSGTSPAAKIPPADGTGIWMDTGTTVALVARTGSAAPGVPNVTSPLFASLEEPVLNNADQIAFLATLDPVKGSVTPATNQGVWSNCSGTLKLVARTGDAAAGVTGGKYSKFNQIVLPDNGGPIFLAQLRGVKPNIGTGLWSVSADGQIHLLLQTGDVASIHGTSKVIRSFSIFTVCPQVSGQSRSFDAATRTVAFLATFSDGTWAILQAVAP